MGALQFLSQTAKHQANSCSGETGLLARLSNSCRSQIMQHVERSLAAVYRVESRPGHACSGSSLLLYLATLYTIYAGINSSRSTGLPTWDPAVSVAFVRAPSSEAGESHHLSSFIQASGWVYTPHTAPIDHVSSLLADPEPKRCGLL